MIAVPCNREKRIRSSDGPVFQFIVLSCEKIEGHKGKCGIEWEHEEWTDPRILCPQCKGKGGINEPLDCGECLGRGII